MFGIDIAYVVCLSNDVGEAMAVMSREVVVDRDELLRIFLPFFFKVLKRGFENFPARGFLFEVRAGGISDAENTDQPGQRESLQHQGYEDYAKSKKNDQVAMGKGS